MDDDLIERLRGALDDVLAFVGQMTCEQFIDALYANKTPGLERLEREDLIIKLDAALSRAWSARARQGGPDHG